MADDEPLGAMAENDAGGARTADSPSDPVRDGPEDESDADGTLAEQVELLAAENQRLRSEYVRARRTTHRRTAAGLVGVGAVALLAAVAFPGSRTVLFALGFTGLFGGALTYFLTPERFIAAATGERAYAAFARTGDLLTGELALQDVRAYAPAADADETPVRLFVPSSRDYAVPDPETLTDLFVVTDDDRERGVSVVPTGGPLYREFEGVAGDAAETPGVAARELADALVEVFELVGRATTDLDPADGRLLVEVEDSAFGPVDRFDHPVVSLVAVGMAVHLDAVVTAEVAATPDGDGDYLVTCEWDAEETG